MVLEEYLEIGHILHNDVIFGLDLWYSYTIIYLAIGNELEQCQEIIKYGLENREQNLLNVVKRTIYGNENSPYLKLLKLVGCGYGDFERICILALYSSMRIRGWSWVAF